MCLTLHYVEFLSAMLLPQLLLYVELTIQSKMRSQRDCTSRLRLVLVVPRFMPSQPARLRREFLRKLNRVRLFPLLSFYSHVSILRLVISSYNPLHSSVNDDNLTKHSFGW